MGKKRGYNWKGRQVLETQIDDEQTKKIKLDMNVEGNYDENNALVLPSTKRKTKIKSKEIVVKILNKKQRKKLEKIIQKKEKKLARAELLEQLQQVQATPEELSQLTSIASVQTKGLKSLFTEQKIVKSVLEPGPNCPKINSVKGARRKLLQYTNKSEYDKNDPNIVGLQCSSSEEDTDDENVDAEKSDGYVNSDQDVDIIENSNKATEIEETKDANNRKNEGSLKKQENKKEQVKKVIARKPAVFVEVHRSEDIQKVRLKLPILAEEQQIMEVINENDIIIIAGETGSGKTTQVPQFLYEAGYAMKKMIGITEPRRVAAISMSERVAHEMNLTSDEVSYLIRFEGNVTDMTKIKFMTDGVLLKELQTDFFLTKYSVIILDEAHERSVYTDILIGFLSRIVPCRKKRGDPLKFIIMSATLRLQDFTDNRKLFKAVPPVVNVSTRQFPVTIHFNRITHNNYVSEALKKTVKIHNTLPEGGILVFVTGQKEVNFLVRKLRNIFPLKNKDKVIEISKNLNKKENTDDEDKSDSSEDDFDERVKKYLKKKKKLRIVPKINLDDYGIPGNEENDSEYEELSESEGESIELAQNMNSEPLWVLPLYSLLPSYKQAKVFEKAPEGCRLCIVSTNVAETSLTIPNIKYVVDSGKTKTKLYEKTTGVTRYEVTWTSKASANQRAGRAGRTAPGHCYRLYSSAVFNDDFQDFSIPEIKQKPVDDLFLLMKCMQFKNVINFPFPTPPDLLQLKTAEHRLDILGLVENSKVTELGRKVAKFPLLPRFGLMLVLSLAHDVLPYTILLVAALSVQEVLLETPTTTAENRSAEEKWQALRRKWAKTGNFLYLGDLMVLLTAVGAAEHANSLGKLERFCFENGLRHKSVIEIRKLRLQITKEVNLTCPGLDAVVDPELKAPSDSQVNFLRRILLQAMGDQVAKKMDLSNLQSADKKKFRYAYNAANMEEPVHMHRYSVLKKELPEYVIYQEIYETNKMYMRGITAVEPEWFPQYAPKVTSIRNQ